MAVLLYIACIFLAPLICWVLWFIGGFFYSYVAGNEIEDGDLNYFSMVGDEGFLVVNIWVWILWPLGLALASLVCIGYIVYGLGSWLGASLNLHKINLTDRINNSVRNRKKAKN